MEHQVDSVSASWMLSFSQDSDDRHTVRQSSYSDLIHLVDERAGIGKKLWRLSFSLAHSLARFPRFGFLSLRCQRCLAGGMIIPLGSGVRWIFWGINVASSLKTFQWPLTKSPFNSSCNRLYAVTATTHPIKHTLHRETKRRTREPSHCVCLRHHIVELRSFN